MILRQREAVLAQFKTAGLDYLVIWPYDQGGCTGKECAPWGGNGFLKLAPEIAALFRREFPNGKVVLSTWYFDHFTSGEWEILAQRFETKADWVNYILADDAPAFPCFPLERGVPGKLPMIGFPEISMRGAGGWGPWGGFGANPFPGHLQARQNQAGAKLAGGFPYSEGLFEDINKIVCAGFDWDNRAADATLREYIAYEFSPDVVDEVMRAIPILEANLTRAKSGEGASTRFVMSSVAGAREADALLEKAQGKLSPRAKTAWRWRILRLRAALDVELSQNEFALTPRAEEMLRELTQIYQAQNAAAPVAPPTQEALRANRPV